MANVGGEGHAVSNNRFIINVAGELGEIVRFRLYDKVTETYLDIDQAISYTHQRGSLQNPLRLSYDGVADGIQSISDSPLKGDNIHEQGQKAVNLAGQSVSSEYRGIVIVNGRKVIK